jgi:zinc/manganese transport system ATP-binding protein
MSLLSTRNLTLGYGRRPAVHHLSGSFTPGAITAVVGPNGAGKSTLLKALAGHIRPLDGTITRSDHTARDVAYMPQVAEIDRAFPITMGQLVAMGSWGGRWLSRTPRAPVEAALDAVGLHGFYTRPLHAASVGQVQRALFARTMIQNAPVVLLDEPFAALDAPTTARMLDHMQQWADQGRTVIAVIHDLDLVRAHCPQALLLARAPVAWGPTPEVLSPGHLHTAHHMPEDWDHHAHICHTDAGAVT